MLQKGRSIRMLVGCFDFFDPPEEFASYLYASEDGGITWEMTLSPEPVFASQSTLIYFDADRALLFGREMFSGADGGRTWNYVKTVNWDGQFTFVDQQQGWAIASSSEGVALVNTVDGGRTWVADQASNRPVIWRLLEGESRAGLPRHTFASAQVWLRAAPGEAGLEKQEGLRNEVSSRLPVNADRFINTWR